MASLSKGKDSTTGHWEIGGVVTTKPFPIFPNGFPEDIIEKFEKLSGVKIIGNYPASGTEIIEKLGEKHLKSKDIILYTSADSVFQLAAHEDIYPIERLYEICLIARKILVDEYGVSRVIARPFTGEPGNFTRTANRKDFSLIPPEDTILDLMLTNNFRTLAIGKISDLFAGQGISNHIKTVSNDGGMLAIKTAIEKDNKHQLIFANLLDFDMLWGHRRDTKGFAGGLEKFDEQLLQVISLLKENDILIITADHGCDPTYLKHTDHTREYVPLLVYGKSIKAGVDLGVRESFTDIAKTIAELFHLENNFKGTSFLGSILPEKVN
jgi:phosphopentomutase